MQVTKSMKAGRARWWLGLVLSFLVASCAEPPPASEPASAGGQAERITQIPLPGSGYIYDVAVVEGAVWVTSHAGLFRIDPVASGAVNVLPHDYLFRAFPGYGDLWITTGSFGRVLRFDPRTSGLVAEIDIGAGPVTSLAVSEDAVWVSAVSDLVRIDPSTNQVVDRVRSELTFGDVAFGEGWLWIIAGANKEGAVWRVDPGTAEVQQKTPLPNPSFWNEIEAGDGAIWVTSSPTVHRGGEALVHLHRIDPSTGDITADVPLGASPPGGATSLSSLTLADGSVWAHVEIESNLIETNPQSLGILQTLEGIEGFSSDVGSGMTFGPGEVWVTAPEAVTRVSL
jgi:hypothetical protein